MSIRVEKLHKSFDGHQVLVGVDLEIPTGELVALLGPSGSGKTTLLRILSGLELPDRGRVYYGDRDVTRVPARERDVGLVFQHYALFKHLDVFENVAFPLRIRKIKEASIKDRVAELLALVRLEGFEGRSPSQLSGGQRQRVALARALASEPKLLLLDEPFGALDAKVRRELRVWLRKLHERVQVTTVFVTHDCEEAFEVADKVVITHLGRIEQTGRPEQIYQSPASRFVMDFLGQSNVFRGSVEGGRATFGVFEVDAPEHEGARQDAVGYVRPHEIELEGHANGEPCLRAAVTRVHSYGGGVRVELSAEGFDTPLRVELDEPKSAALSLVEGSEVFVHPRRFRVFVEDRVS